MLTLSKGQQLSDRFTLLSLNGQGSMGDVWLAQDGELGERVALKILNPDFTGSPAMVDLLRHECRNARRLIHPNIVRVFDFHADNDVFFISMQYIEGADFSQFRGLEYKRFLGRLLPILDALDYAHSLGMVHRDLKPGNILCDEKGTPYLTDFGIAAALGDESAATLMSRGSLFYQSPQQIDREPPIPGDDIYALGAVIYEMIDGHPPFYPDASEEKVRREVPPPPVSNVPVPVRLEQLVFRMLAKSPGDRPASIREVREDLAALLNVEEGGTAPPEIIVRPAVGGGAEDAITPVSRTTGFEADLPLVPAQSKQTVSARKAWLAMAVLIVVGAGVIFFLPKSIEPRQPDLTARTSAPQAGGHPMPTPATGSGASASGLAPYEQAQLTQQREEAQRIVTQMLRKQAKLEKQGVMNWGAAAFSDAREEADRGDEMFLDKMYTEAGEAYVLGLKKFEQLEQRAQELLETSVADGWSAFNDHDAATAIDRFQLALSIHPGHSDALHGLGRANSLDEALQHYRAGQTAEKQNDFAAARTGYQQALQLDPEFESARSSLNRISGYISSNRFEQAMSNGFATLERRDYDAARKAFENAARQRPGSSEPEDGLAQVTFLERQDQILKLKRQAEILEGQERWGNAAGRYDKVLELDANIVFAQEGRDRALNLEELYGQINLYITQPERMATEEVYQNAVSLFYEAAALAGKGAILTSRLAELEQVLKAARTPVRVMLQSDNVTDVMLFRVGSLGTFENHELELYPGTYTVVGSRDGYRDIRRKFTIIAGQIAAPIIVRCEDKI